MLKMELKECLECSGKICDINYYSDFNSRGFRIYLAQIEIEKNDNVILENKSFFLLKEIVKILCPLLVESRSV